MFYDNILKLSNVIFYDVIFYDVKFFNVTFYDVIFFNLTFYDVIFYDVTFYGILKSNKIFRTLIPIESNKVSLSNKKTAIKLLLLWFFL